MTLSRTLLVSTASFVVVGCMPARGPSADASAQMTESCNAQMDKFVGTYCDDKTTRDLGSAQVSAPLAQQATALEAQCSAYAPPDRVARMDACVAKIQGAAMAAHDSQKARLPEAKAKEPSVRADPQYSALVDHFRKVDDEYLVAYDNAQTAKKNGNPNLSRYQLRAEDAQKERTKAEADLIALFKKYGLEPSDAKLLGLW
jgi:hypothetical protein